MLVTLKRDPMFAITVPGKIQSYMACGKPIIAALDGEGAELIRESKTGLVSPAEDPERLTENVLRMYRMQRSDREKMGNNGLQFCRKHFEREMLIGKLDKWMREIYTKSV